jgi:monofunctional biosynthetic peptidoglycan transglycosylase
MKSLLKTLFTFLCSIILLFVVGFIVAYFSTPDVLTLKSKNPSTTAFIESKKREALAEGKKFVVQQRWISLKEVPELLTRTIILAEDASFWIHEGIDWYEVKQSIKKDWEEGEFTRGGSTITQQLAKNLYLSSKKTIYRKIREWFIAKKLENKLKKSRILELYLNVIELGRGVFGIAAASQNYFGKEPNELELSEMVRVAAIIPNPLSLNPNYPSSGLKWRSRIILKRLYKFNFISEEEYLRTTEILDGFFNT